ncbi:MAG: hypothetical protein DRH17_10975 [Deltaproteobacteria bacterium]|nr:MAG: hypothetical protein DRH17_10975 [Deltaproteobacteria bacterium]
MILDIEAPCSKLQGMRSLLRFPIPGMGIAGNNWSAIPEKFGIINILTRVTKKLNRLNTPCQTPSPMLSEATAGCICGKPTAEQR